MVQTISHRFNTHVKRLSLSASVVIIIITRLLATSRIITQYSIIYCYTILPPVHLKLPGRIAQSVTFLATDACLTADPGVASSIPVRSHTFVEIDHEMISTVILLPSADSFKKGCCQLQAKVCARITG